jgi:hypothetical protein
MDRFTDHILFHRKGQRHSTHTPIGYRIIAKTDKYRDEKNGQGKRKNPITKNKMMQDMISRQIRNAVKFGSILADSWYSSADKNMRFIKKGAEVYI